MASKETIEQFLANFKNWPTIIQKNATKIFNESAVLAWSKSRQVAPRDTGELINSSRVMHAKLTTNGITSGYYFPAHSDKGFYYPTKVNEGEGIEIKTGKNANAQSHFAEAGVESVQDNLMSKMGNLIEEVFIQS